MIKTYRASAGIMLAPAVTLIGIFILLPMLLTIWLSFQD
ncbi:MAG: sugar ABC transporter permease, partial [Mesorhizobium sp.]